MMIMIIIIINNNNNKVGEDNRIYKPGKQHLGTITCSRAYNLISDRSILPHRASQDDYLR